MNTTWLNTAEECFAQTLSGARLSPRGGSVLFNTIMQTQFTRHVRGGCLRNQKRSLTAGAVKGFRCLRKDSNPLGWLARGHITGGRGFGSTRRTFFGERMPQPNGRGGFIEPNKTVVK
jgi:hypothetical protein